MKKWILLAALSVCSALMADVYLIDGERVEGEVHEINGQRTICTDTKCFFLPANAIKVSEGEVASGAEPLRGEVQGTDCDGVAPPLDAASTQAPRLAQGYMKPHELLSFLRGDSSGDALEPFADKSVWAILVAVLLGGLLMNLTPCVLPMMPINLMIIGKSAGRGALYGLGIALAYGIMGVLAAVGGMAFGEIQGSPWFNLVIALIFFALSLSLFGVYFIDFSKHRAIKQSNNRIVKQFVFPFVMGVVSAVLAGACVAPILIAVLLLTAKLYAEGTVLALGLPFVLGLGMGLPWPFAGAGLTVLPKPGAWMAYVNKAFGVLVLGFAAWYGYLAYTGFTADVASEPADAPTTKHLTATPETFPDMLPVLKRPVFVDCWATWCKNCTAMEKTTLQDASVVEELANFTVIKLQAEDISALKKIPGFEGVKGLPAFVLFE